MSYQTYPTWVEPGVGVRGSAQWFGTSVPDGDADPWIKCPIGTEYLYKSSETANPVKYTKIKDDSRDDDWSTIVGVVGVYVTYTDFTDNLDNTAQYDLSDKIPQGAFVLQAVIENLTGFAGDTTATLQIGDGTTVDRYNTGTPSVFATAVAVDPGVPSGTKIHIAAATPRLKITTTADWGSVTAGAMTVRIYYLH